MGTVEDTITNAFQVGYKFAKEKIKAPIFLLVEEALIDDVQKGHLDILLVRKVTNWRN